MAQPAEYTPRVLTPEEEAALLAAGAGLGGGGMSPTVAPPPNQVAVAPGPVQTTAPAAAPIPADYVAPPPSEGYRDMGAYSSDPSTDWQNQQAAAAVAPPPGLGGVQTAVPQNYQAAPAPVPAVGVGFTPERSVAVPGVGGSIGAGGMLGIGQDRTSLVPTTSRATPRSGNWSPTSTMTPSRESQIRSSVPGLNFGDGDRGLSWQDLNPTNIAAGAGDYVATRRREMDEAKRRAEAEGRYESDAGFVFDPTLIGGGAWGVPIREGLERAATREAAEAGAGRGLADDAVRAVDDIVHSNPNYDPAPLNEAIARDPYHGWGAPETTPNGGVAATQRPTGQPVPETTIADIVNATMDTPWGREIQANQRAAGQPTPTRPAARRTPVQPTQRPPVETTAPERPAPANRPQAEAPPVDTRVSDILAREQEASLAEREMRLRKREANLPKTGVAEPAWTPEARNRIPAAAPGEGEFTALGGVRSQEGVPAQYGPIDPPVLGPKTTETGKLTDWARAQNTARTVPTQTGVGGLANPAVTTSGVGGLATRPPVRERWGGR